MGSTQGEIRIGVSHQARLPENRLECSDLSPDPEFLREREEIRWIPNMTLDGDLVMYLRAARSMAAFAGMCDGGSAEDGCIAASRDGTTSNAMDVLHDSGYDPGKALQTLMKCPMPKSVDKRWSEEETKRFVKGLRQYGKNFFRIRKDLLPHKETPELVEFYYLWKKTPAANNNRPHRRRRQGSLRRSRNTRNNKSGTSKEEVKDEGNNSRPSSNPKERGDGSSGSEDYNSYDDSDSKENGGYRCQHCFTKRSRDWQHATSGPKQGALLCYTCRSYYKQFGEFPSVGRGEAPYLFQPVPSIESPETSPGRMRTRNKAKETPSKEKPKGKKADRAVTPDLDFEKKLNNGANDRSPMSNSNSNSPGEKPKKKGKTDGSLASRKRALEIDDDDEDEQSKRKRDNGTDSPAGSDLSDSDSADEVDDTISPSSVLTAEEKDLTKPLDSSLIETNFPVTAVVHQSNESVVDDKVTADIVNSSDNTAATTTSTENFNVVKTTSPVSDDTKEDNISHDKMDEFNKDNPVTGGQIPAVPYEDEELQDQHQEYYESTGISNEDTRSLDHHLARSLADQIVSNNNDDDDDDDDDDDNVRMREDINSSESVVIKSEAGIFDSPSPERNEILPPVLLSSDDSYIVPKEEMPTLCISSNIRDEDNRSSFSPPPLRTMPNNDFSSNNLPCSTATSRTVATTIPVYEDNVAVNIESIKLERNTAHCDEIALENNVPPQQQNARIRVSESLLQGSSPSTAARRSDSPIQLTAYSHMPPPESLRPSVTVGEQTVDKSHHSQSVLLSSFGAPAQSSFNETDHQNEKTAGINMSVPGSIAPQHHHPMFHPYYFPPPPSHIEKMDTTPPSYMIQKSNGIQQMEPQDLKVKQEVLPPDSGPPSVDPLQSLKEVKVPGYAAPSSMSQQQSLLSVSTSSSSLSMSSNVDTTASTSLNSPSLLPPSNMHMTNIKKEMIDSYGGPMPVPMCMKSPTVASLKASSDMSRNISPSRQSPSYSVAAVQLGQSPPPSTIVGSNRSPVSSPVLNIPSSIPQSLIHPSQQQQQQSSPLNRVSPGSAHLAHPHPYMAALHSHHHPLIQQSLFAAAAAAAAHHNPYSHHPYAAGYPYAFPYGPYPIPQPIPPPRPSDIQKRETDAGGSSTILTSHQSSSSSSSITTRSLRNEESNVHAQEIMQTHHHSSSHHASIHHHSDKQTISHSTSSSSSASIHHKVKRSSSPQHSSSSCHVSATLSQSTSSTVSSANHGQNSHHHHHQHHHQHQHTHHHQTASTEPMSPLLNMSIPLGVTNNNSNNNNNGNSNSSSNSSNRNNPIPAFGNNSHQGKSPHPSGMPGPSPVLPNHHGALALSGLSPSGSLDALRAHAAALHVGPLQLQSSPHGIPPGHPAYMTGPDMHLNHQPGPESMLPPTDEQLYGILPEEEELPSPTHHIPKGPSPEPKVEDSECHRSQSAIFLRHWNRGDYNSCARTDLTFKPVPDSKLARTREERIRKQAEKDREEKEKAQSRKLSTPDKADAVIKPPSRGPIETITSPYDRFTARGTPYASDTPALRQLSEYARPHTSFSPVTLQRSAASLGIPPQCIDPMIHYQLNMNMYGSATRERFELEHFEREKRERELRELREKELNDRLKEEIMKSTGSRLPNSVDPHWLDLQRRFNALGPGAPGLNPFGLYPGAGGPGQAPGLSPLERERLERLGPNGAAYSRAGLIPGRDPTLGLHHPSDLLARPYADQLAHQAAAHEQLQRQMLLERERYPHPALVAQHEEYIRKLYLM